MTETQSAIIDAIDQLASARHASDTTGHDYHHVRRVHDLALTIHASEQGNLFLIRAAALLHDYADFKLTADIEAALAELRAKLLNLSLENSTIDQLFHIISQISFKGASVDTTPDCIEAMIVQDADRIDALGAVGIARTFAYGGAHNSPIHIPDLPPTEHQSFEHYKNHRGSSINHFYEKLLLLKDRINTPSAQTIANQRHDFMLIFLKQFYSEWPPPPSTTN